MVVSDGADTAPPPIFVDDVPAEEVDALFDDTTIAEPIMLCDPFWDIEGATDVEIHDTVLIAAAFCMYNRYVDGLATFTPADERVYDDMGRRMAHQGYVNRR